MMVGGRDFTPGPHGPNWVACSALGEGAVLKTEGMASREGPQRSAAVRFCASRFHDRLPCPLVSATLTVCLAVNSRSRLSDARALYIDAPTSCRGRFELLPKAALGNSR